MKTAAMAAKRGHQVILMEKERDLGGHLTLLKELPTRAEWRTVASLPVRTGVRKNCRHSSLLIWLVDPLRQALEVFRPEGRHWVLVNTHGGAETVRATPFETLELDMGHWWLEPESGQP
jgi:hypothetical protein